MAFTLAAKRVLLHHLLLLTITMTIVPLCGGQMANLTLIEIAPCSGTVVQTVSRFKSDIFAVKASLGACPLNDTSLAANGRLVSTQLEWSNPAGYFEKPALSEFARYLYNMTSKTPCLLFKASNKPFQCDIPSFKGKDPLPQ